MAHINNPLVKEEISREGKKYIKEEISREGKKYIRENKNENMSNQNLWDTAKAVLRRKFIVQKNMLERREGNSQIIQAPVRT